MNNHARKALKIAHIKLKIIVFVLLPIVVFTLVTSKTSLLGGFRSFVVLTGSMQPTISAGSLLYTQSQPSYQKGDIIAFQKENVVVTHRIVEATSSGFITKGDANNAPDTEPVQQASILGKSVLAIPYVGQFILFLKTLPGFLIFIILPALIFIALEFKTIKKELEKDIEKKILKKLEQNKDA